MIEAAASRVKSLRVDQMDHRLCASWKAAGATASPPRGIIWEGPRSAWQGGECSASETREQATLTWIDTW
jgi:hypothetical protein